jgi:tRNA-Thr(GGU) m(6)t(6)A37 methyltransferase TsaA
MTREVAFKPIGVVRSPFVEVGDGGRSAVVSEIHIDASLVAGLRGIEDFSHIVIVYYLHKSEFDPKTDLTQHPRGRADRPERGVFALRSNRRPNAIGLTTVELLGVDGSVLRVKGLDALDGSPVLDIKPYVPPFGNTASFAVPAWVERLGEDK